MIDRSYFTKNTCNLCRSIHEKEVDKSEHLKTEIHRKKEAVHVFIVEELADSDPDESSILNLRYLKSGIPYIGAQNIVELQLKSSEDRFWLCKSCLVADSTLKTVDSHLYSREHVQNSLRICIDEHTRESFYDKLEDEVRGVPELEKWMTEVRFSSKFIASHGPSLACAYRYPETSSESLKKQLMISSDHIDPYKQESVHDNHDIVFCQVCKNVFFSRTDENSFKKTFEEHVSTREHQEAVFFETYLAEVPKEIIPDLPPVMKMKDNFDFVVNIADGVAYGPVMGLEYCYSFGPEVVCTICYCVVPSDSAHDHFSSEAHCERYLRGITPARFCSYSTVETRRNILESVAEENAESINDYHYYEASIKLPSIFRQIAKPEKRILEIPQAKRIGNQGSAALICDICKCCFRESSCSWDSHIEESEEHFEKLVQWQSVQRDERSFIFEKSNLPNLNRKKNCQWSDRNEIGELQNYCEFGMDLIFRDALNKAYYCTCCYEEIPEENKELVVLHARSLNHIKTALCVISPEMAVELLNVKNATEMKGMILDYLKHNPSLKSTQKIKCFDPLTSFILNMTIQIPRCLLRLTEADFHLRDGFVKENKIKISNGKLNFSEEKDFVFLTTAISTTNLILSKIDTKNIVFWCMDCEMSFSVPQDDARRIWSDHLLTKIHWMRSNCIDQNILSLDCLQDEPSKYQPKLHGPEDKKFPWIWNPELNCYQFVLNSKLIHRDVIHREQYHGVTNFFCSLCCEIFEPSESSLTAHIRSFKHMFFYFHKYFSPDVDILENILMEFGNDVSAARCIVRNFIADKIRSSESRTSKIPYYDARVESCKFQKIQKIIEKEKTSFHIMKVQKIMKINNLPSLKEMSSVSLHRLSSKIPDFINIKGPAVIHMLLEKLIDVNTKDVSPYVKEGVQSKHGPRSESFGSGRFPKAIDSPDYRNPGVIPGSSKDVFNSVEAEQVPMDMDMSDDEMEKKNRKSRSRNFSPIRQKHRTPSPIRRSRYSRSRSPSRLSGTRSGSPKSDRNRRSVTSKKIHEELDRKSNHRRHRDEDYCRSKRERGNQKSPVYRLTPPPDSFESQRKEKFDAHLPSKIRKSSSIQDEFENRDFRKREFVEDYQRIPPGVDENVYLKNLRNQVSIAPGTRVLPPVDLTKQLPQTFSPPIGIPQGMGNPIMASSRIPSFNPMIPPPIMSSQMPGPLVMPPQMPGPSMIPPQIPGPSGMIPFQMPGIPPMMDIAMRAQIAKMNMYERDLSKLTSRAEVIEYMLEQGHDEIPESDPPLLFNEILKKKKKVIGAEHLSQVICFNEPDYETYICLLCTVWTTVSDMFNHLKSSAHRLNFIKKSSFKTFHAKAIMEENEKVRGKMLEEFVSKILKIEEVKTCKKRMRCIMNRKAIERCWFNVEEYIDNSWKLIEDENQEDTEMVEKKENRREEKRYSERDKNRSRDKDRDRNRDHDHYDRGRDHRNGSYDYRDGNRDYRDKEISREYEHGRDRNREQGYDKDRSYKKERDRRERERERVISASSKDNSERSESLDQKQNPPERSPTPLWEKQTHIFSESLEELAARPNMDIEYLERVRNERLISSLNTVTPKEPNPSGFDFQNEAEYDGNEKVKISASEKRMIEQQKEKQKRDEFQKKISALVLIHQEVADNKTIDRDTVCRICKETNVVPEEIFQDEIMDETAKIIGEDSIYPLMMALHQYNNPLEPPSKVLQENTQPNSAPHAATVLAGIGMDKAEIANLLKKIAMAKKQLHDMRRKMIAAGLNPGDIDYGIDDEGPYFGPPQVVKNLNKNQGASLNKYPPQIPDDYQGPVMARISCLSVGREQTSEIGFYDEQQMNFSAKKDYYADEYGYRGLYNPDPVVGYRGSSKTVPSDPRSAPLNLWGTVGVNPRSAPLDPRGAAGDKTRGTKPIKDSTVNLGPGPSWKGAVSSGFNPPPPKRPYMPSGDTYNNEFYGVSTSANSSADYGSYYADADMDQDSSSRSGEEITGDWDAAENVLTNLFK